MALSSGCGLFGGIVAYPRLDGSIWRWGCAKADADQGNKHDKCLVSDECEIDR